MTTKLAFFLSSFMMLLSNITRVSVELSEGKCEELPEQVCPACGSGHLIKNGSVRKSTPKYQCKSCGRQFIDNPTTITVSNNWLRVLLPGSFCLEAPKYNEFHRLKLKGLKSF